MHQRPESGLEPRHIDTFDQNADQTRVPERNLPPEERERRHRLLAAAYDRYRLARSYLYRRGGGDDSSGRVDRVDAIEPIEAVRPIRDFRL